MTDVKAPESKEPDLTLIEQGDGSVMVSGAQGSDMDEQDPAEIKAGDEDMADATLAEGEEEEADEPALAGESDDEAEARRARNRARRAQNKQHRRDYIESLKRQIVQSNSVATDLANRLSALERRSTSTDMAQLDAAINQAGAAYNEYKALNKRAIEEANGEAATEAQERMFAALQRYQQLTNHKAAIERDNLRMQADPKPADPRVTKLAQGFADKHPWYEPRVSEQDEDSAVLYALDSQMSASGWNPATKEYWDELERRVEKFLPHRAVRRNNQSAKGNSRSPVAGSGREGVSGNNRRPFVLTKEQVEVMKQAGIWDNPKLKSDAIRRYMDQARNASN